MCGGVQRQGEEVGGGGRMAGLLRWVRHLHLLSGSPPPTTASICFYTTSIHHALYIISDMLIIHLFRFAKCHFFYTNQMFENRFCPNETDYTATNTNITNKIEWELLKKPTCSPSLFTSIFLHGYSLAISQRLLLDNGMQIKYERQHFCCWF